MLKSKNDFLERPIAVEFNESEIIVTLASGQVIRNPLSWHPRLMEARAEQRAHYELSTFSVDWPDFDEGLDIEGMIRGIPSDPEQKQVIEKLRAIMGDPQKRELLLSFLDLLNRTPA